MEILAGAALIAVLIQKIVEHIRKDVPRLDGVWLLVASSAIGLAFAYGTGIRVVEGLLPDTAIAPWLDVTVTGFVLGAGAGFLADVSGRSGSSPAPVVVDSELGRE